MGHVKTDIHAKSRTYSVTYTLSDPKGVAKLLRDRHRIAERRFRGDYDASDIIIDLHSAIESAGLTDRQAEAIAWVYGFDMTQKDAARIMGITQEAVSMFANGGCERIAEVFRKWGERDSKDPYQIEVTYERTDAI